MVSTEPIFKDFYLLPYYSKMLISTSPFSLVLILPVSMIFELIHQCSMLFLIIFLSSNTFKCCYQSWTLDWSLLLTINSVSPIVINEYILLVKMVTLNSDFHSSILKALLLRRAIVASLNHSFSSELGH